MESTLTSSYSRASTEQLGRDLLVDKRVEVNLDEPNTVDKEMWAKRTLHHQLRAIL